jgi:hypothetical protein
MGENIARNMQSWFKYINKKINKRKLLHIVGSLHRCINYARSHKHQVHCAVSFHLYCLCMLYIFLFISSARSASLFFFVLSILHAALVLPLSLFSYHPYVFVSWEWEKMLHYITTYNCYFCCNDNTFTVWVQSNRASASARCASNTRSSYTPLPVLFTFWTF